MRKSLLIFLLLFLCAFAQATERVFITTDRGAYISGDRVWCSLFCVGEDGSLSKESAVAYIELISDGGTAVEEKAALLGGRGCTSFTLPTSLPTGNYRLVAYTSCGGVSISGSKVLSVYNTFTTARVKDGVKISDNYDFSEAPEQSDGISINTPVVIGSGRDFTVQFQTEEPATLAISVFLDDGLAQQEPTQLSDFLAADEHFSQQGPLEYDGEVIRATVKGAPVGTVAMLSSSGSSSDTYVSTVRSDGRVLFPTGNIFGPRELVCELFCDSDDCYMVFDSPFRNPSAGELPQLVLCPSQAEPLVSRKSRLRLNVKSDTLYTFLPKREDLLFETVDWEVYHLDDYTRFPTVKEVVVEILHNVIIGRSHGKPVLQVLAKDGTNSKLSVMDNVLAMLDGVIITDLNILLDFDAMLIQDVEVCTSGFAIGHTPYSGAVNFKTSKNYVTTLDFPSRTRVMDYRGVGFPLAYFGERPSGGTDSRELLYWSPVTEIDGNMGISVAAPQYQGRFCIYAEGLTQGGKAVKAVKYINIR